jgi:hypothetical protein
MTVDLAAVLFHQRRNSLVAFPLVIAFQMIMIREFVQAAL